MELSPLAPELSGADLAATLSDLIWAGCITNDTVQPLRSLTVRSRGRSRGASRASVAGGRWSCVGAAWQASEATPEHSTRRAHHIAKNLLDRYAIVCREAAAAEELTGGFSAVYDVYKTMEETGNVRRGYFVEGVGGAQFAYGFAIERLRAQRQTTEFNGDVPVQVLAALDPANAYGAILPWPQKTVDNTRALRRVAGAWVILHQGALLGYLDAKGATLVTFAACATRPDVAALLAAGCKRIAMLRRSRAVRLQTIDADPALAAAWTQGLIAAGAQHTFDALVINAV